MHQFASYEIVKSRAAQASERAESLRRAGMLGVGRSGGAAWERFAARLTARRPHAACCAA